jgi:hypothetical protein
VPETSSVSSSVPLTPSSNSIVTISNSPEANSVSTSTTSLRAPSTTSTSTIFGTGISAPAVLPLSSSIESTGSKGGLSKRAIGGIVGGVLGASLLAASAFAVLVFHRRRPPPPVVLVSETEQTDMGAEMGDGTVENNEPKFPSLRYPDAYDNPVVTSTDVGGRLSRIY